MTEDIKHELERLIDECLAKGPGYAQEGVILRQAAERLHLRGDVGGQQRLLTCWHDLFREGTLSWGYDVDNPNAPFFHRAQR